MIPRTIPALAMLGAVLACSGNDEGQRIPLAQAASASPASAEAAAHALIGPQALAALDSGNTLFRAKNYRGALGLYRVAADLAPQHSAPLFGIYMVGRETKNTALADSALAEIRKRGGPATPAPHAFDDSTLKALHDSVAATGPAARKAAKGG